MIKLHLFTKEGHTFTFYDLTSFQENESMITFSFMSVKDSTKKFGTFYTKNLAGYTYEGTK